MSCINSNILAGASGAGGGKVYVDDVFSTYLYEGNGSTKTITNGIDISDEGGLVWIKRRDAITEHSLSDTARGAGKRLSSDKTWESVTSNTAVSAFNNNGFTINTTDGMINGTGGDYVSWSFRKAPGFFDVVTWSGNGTNPRQISHSLGSVPGMIIVKCTSTSYSWIVYHRSTGATHYLMLEAANPAAAWSDAWNNTAPTSTHFTLGSAITGNKAGETYVAYVFAHDDAQFGTGGDESIIKCGSYTGSSSGVTVDLGFEPQWLLIKNSNIDSRNWVIIDTMRGTGSNNTQGLRPNLTADENTYPNGLTLNATSTGFNIVNQGGDLNMDGKDYIYMAIRRPNKPPEAATDVFNAILRTGTGSPATVDVGFPLDLITTFYTTAAGQSKAVFDRIRGPEAFLATNSPNKEYAVSTNGAISFDSTSFKTNSNGYFNNSGSQFVNHVFRRAPGFMDVVAYDGFLSSGATGTLPHNLTVAPELILFKNRSYSSGYAWYVWNAYSSNTTYLKLNDNAAPSNFGVAWAGGDANNINISYGHIATSQTGNSYVAYLFATLPGISKVGGYTGDGGTQVINCGFTNGARFVLIRRTDSSGHWYLWDTARGITNGNDKYFEINGTGAQYTENDNDLAPDSSGFKVRHGGATDININTATYIFLAIA